MSTGMMQMVFSGEAATVSALHDHVLEKMPRGPYGAVKYQMWLFSCDLATGTFACRHAHQCQLVATTQGRKCALPVWLRRH